jgi:hypothetical protein
MFATVVEGFQKATEANLQFQQDMYKKWMSLWPGVPMYQDIPAEQAQKFQKKWGEFVSDLIKRQGEFIDAQFKHGVQNVEKVFEFGEIKSPEELRAKSLDLWQQCFESLRQAYEAQIKDFQKATGKWFDLVTKP